MTRIHQVILDLDDVLNTFCMSALHYHGVANTNYDYSEYPPHCGWDIVQACNWLRRKRSWPSEEQDGRCACVDAATFWEALTQEFWAATPPVPYLDTLITYLADRVGKDNVIVATSPTKSPTCVAGKLEWIHRHLPTWLHRNYMIGPRKDLLADPYSLLIDDRRGNCEKFEGRGGHALMVHKPWNYEVWDKHERHPIDWQYTTPSSIECGLYRIFRKRIEL